MQRLRVKRNLRTGRDPPLWRGGRGAAGPALRAGGRLRCRASANSGALDGGDVLLVFTKQALGRSVRRGWFDARVVPAGFLVFTFSSGHVPGSLRRLSLAARWPRPGEA